MSERKSPRNRLRPLETDVAGAVIVVAAPVEIGQLAVENLAKHRVLCPPPWVVKEGPQALRRAVTEAIAGGARLIITCGGTGVTSGDGTPEVSAEFIDQRLWAIETQVLLRGLENTPLAALSRAMIGVCRQGPRGVVIANAPGSRGGVKDTISVVGPLFAHLLEQLDNTD